MLVFSLIGILFCSLSVSTQQNSGDTESLNAQIEAARADVRADKITIINEAMKFTSQESSAFWPIYKRYSQEVSQLNDERVKLILSYADKFTTLTDADAKQMADKAFDLESRRVALKKKYYPEFNKQLSAITVTKFFQLEHRLDLLVDLKVAASLPSLLVKPVATAQTEPQK
jgi:hypothetical protein